MITIPTISELNTDILSDIETKYGSPVSPIGKSFLRAWAGVMAGVLYLIYLSNAKVQKNIFADTCDYETLIRFGRVKLGRNPFPATAALYEVELIGEIGATIPVSATFKSDDDSANPGKLYILDYAFTFVSPTGLVVLRALESGIDSKLNVGDTLTATAPIALVESVGEVTFEDEAPLSAETESEYRTKVLNAFRLEPQGGAGADYRLWAADVQEVANSYPFAAVGFTEVNLFIESKIADSPDDKGSASTATLDDVKSAIEDPTVDRPSRKPILDVVNYISVTPLDIVVTITGLVGATPATEAAITAKISEEISRIRPFVSSIDVLANKNDILSNFKLIGLILEAAPGSVFSSVTFTVDGGLISSFTFENGFIPYFDSVNFV